MSYQGIPLAQSPNSGVLVLSSDPVCGDTNFTFAPAPQPRKRHLSDQGCC
jgi:hypothetical protein